VYEFRTERRIEFADTDMGGIVHFARYFVFMETAEHQFLNALGTSVVMQHEGRRIGWPRVAASCEYKSPARFGETLEILVRVRRKGASSMTYDFSFMLGRRETAKGSMTSVCCVLEADEVRPVPIPDFLRERLEEAPSTDPGHGRPGQGG
jgi:4-hydroxybenzoyl-CoA thioesterase/acyl-CoA thioester hydrolase